MLNINYCHNRRLMEKCRRLEEYAIFVATVRKFAAIEHCTLEDAITLAVEECINTGVLVDVLKEQRAEVFEVILETFDKELFERDLRINLRAEVKAEVRAEIMEEVKSEIRAEVKSEVREEVKAALQKENEQSFLQLLSNMVEDGMANDIPRLSKEPAFLEQMYKKYLL